MREYKNVRKMLKSEKEEAQDENHKFNFISSQIYFEIRIQYSIFIIFISFLFSSYLLIVIIVILK